MKNCKHQWKIVDVKDETPWLDRIFLGSFRRKLIISHCRKCGEIKYEKEK